tara:strand:- start:30 stop:218 length:189 start_codon:yes stop_codon:yes gene_type:complete
MEELKTTMRKEKSYFHNFWEALDNGEIVESLVSQLEREQADLQSMLVNDKLEIASDWLEFND